MRSNVIAATTSTITRMSRRSAPSGFAEMSGAITINGVTKPVTFTVSLAPHNDPALKFDAGAYKFQAKGRIKRSAVNMTKFLALVDDEVELEIDAIVRAN